MLLLNCPNCKGKGYTRQVFTNPPDNEYQLLMTGCTTCRDGCVSLWQLIKWLLRIK